LKGVDEFNGIQHPGSTQLNILQHQPSMPTESPGNVTVRMIGRERLKVEMLP